MPGGAHLPRQALTPAELRSFGSLDGSKFPRGWRRVIRGAEGSERVTWLAFGERRVELEAGGLRVGHAEGHFQLVLPQQCERRDESQQLLYWLKLLR